MTPIEPVQLADRTLASVRAAIVSGELAPGEPLRDRQLAEMLGVSRTPVREALHRLEALGLVVPRGRGGWVVSPFTEQDVRELFQLRLLLEPLGLEELDRTKDERAIREIAAFFGDYSHPIPAQRYPEYFAEDAAFHKRIVACSWSRRVHDIYSILETQIDRGRHFLITSVSWRGEETLDEHLSIVEAVRDLDFRRAHERLVAHLRTGEELMLEQLRLRMTGS
ncbi:GntR family transcriptional regulator [Pseudonocardia sichuanensis]